MTVLKSICLFFIVRANTCTWAMSIVLKIYANENMSEYWLLWFFPACKVIRFIYSANWHLISFASDYNSEFIRKQENQIYELTLAYISRFDWKNDVSTFAPAIRNTIYIVIYLFKWRKIDKWMCKKIWFWMTFNWIFKWF